MKEYMIVEARKNRAEKTMNMFAEQGWEVVSVNTWPIPCIVMITFAREKQD